MKRWGLCSLTLFAVAACGSSSSAGGGSAAVNGTVSGATVPTTDTIALVGPVTAMDSTGATVTVQELLVLVSNQPKLCSVATRNANPPNATSLGISVGSLNPLVTGTFPVGTLSAAGFEANVFYTAQDATCTLTANQPGLSGTVTITVLSSTTVSGTFDVSLMSGDHLSGSFTAPVCPTSLNAFVNPTSAAACAP